MFQPTHKIVTEANKGRTNGVIHIFKRGTLVQVLDSHGWSVKVSDINDKVQFIKHTDLEAI